MRDLEVRFEGGRAVEVRADVRRGRRCARTSRPTTARRASARSRSSTATRASAQTGLVFYDTLFDENASSHIALGASIVQAVAVGAASSRRRSAHERGVNHSSIHTDFMIGSNELEIDGVDRGRRRPCRSCATATGCS